MAGFDLGQLGGFLARLARQTLQLLQVGAQAADQARLRAGNVACVVDFTRRRSGAFAGKQHLDVTALMLDVFVMDQSRQAGVLRTGGFAHRARLAAEFQQVKFGTFLLFRQIAQGAVGLRYRPLGFPQGIGGLGAVAFGAVDVAL